MELLKSKHYYIDRLNSSKAYQFTSYYHYSGQGFKQAQINLGLFRITDNKLVGVLQWGQSAQQKINLQRYVKELLSHKEYLELNRFCMADSEGKNAESEAIALGIKWIKHNRPDIRLLVSYAGRKEGNYGYIYQATSWEYLGYFISDGFWILNGKETHQINVWYAYKRHCEQIGFKAGLCKYYQQVQHFWSKQFIYIKRLDRTLTLASPLLPYPKPQTEYPIVTHFKTYKDEPFISEDKKKNEPNYFYIANEPLYTKRTLIRQGNLVVQYIAIYHNGTFETIVHSIAAATRETQVSATKIQHSLDNIKDPEEYEFRYIASNQEPAMTIDIKCLCTIDDISFFRQVDIADYCGVSKQAVSQAKQRKATQIAGKQIIWKY